MGQIQSQGSLPTELILHMFSFLELKSYIISHGVCKDWRRLLPLTTMNPTRRRLLELYHYIVNTPHLIKTRPWIRRPLQPFDRTKYIHALLSQYPVIPKEFRMWILEWPDRLAVGCAWPGLPFAECRSPEAPMRRRGVNWLGYKCASPELRAVVYDHRAPTVKFIPGLLIWRSGVTTDWLIFDEEEPALFGRVMITRHGQSVIIPRPKASARHTVSGDDSVDYVFVQEDEDDNSSFPDWITYQRKCWNVTKALWGSRPRGSTIPRPSHTLDCLPIPEPVGMNFNSDEAQILPTPSWRLRHTATRYLQSG